MAASNDFRDMAAWQLAHQLHLRVDLFLYSPEFRRHYRFCDQLGAAARSGPRNIAEGARCKHKQFAEFVRVAQGSEAAVLHHLIEAHDQRLITTDELAITQHLTHRAMDAAAGLIDYLESLPE
jgi:four helix bundle protein